jgi:hypothetical protein
MTYKIIKETHQIKYSESVFFNRLALPFQMK